MKLDIHSELRIALSAIYCAILVQRENRNEAKNYKKVAGILLCDDTLILNTLKQKLTKGGKITMRRNSFLDVQYEHVIRSENPDMVIHPHTQKHTE